MMVLSAKAAAQVVNAIKIHNHLFKKKKNRFTGSMFIHSGVLFKTNDL